MKKTYISPNMEVIQIHVPYLLTGSVTIEALDSFGGYGGELTEGTADGRELNLTDDEFDVEEEY